MNLTPTRLAALDVARRREHILTPRPPLVTRSLRQLFRAGYIYFVPGDWIPGTGCVTTLWALTDKGKDALSSAPRNGAA